MNGDWQRETRVCPPADLHPDLLAAIRAHVERHGFGSVEEHALICFETVSRRTRKANLLERLRGATQEMLRQAVIVTPARLIWAQLADPEDAWATSESLAVLEVTDYEKTRECEALPDRGVRVGGIRASRGRTLTLFFGLGAGPHAKAARRAMKDAVRSARGTAPADAPDGEDSGGGMDAPTDPHGDGA